MSNLTPFELSVIGCVLRLRVVCLRIGISRSTLYTWLDPNSKYYDPTFPRRIRLTGRKGGAIGFLESELELWVKSRADARQQ